MDENEDIQQHNADLQKAIMLSSTTTSKRGNAGANNIGNAVSLDKSSI
jgi:hypothetical protein